MRGILRAGGTLGVVVALLVALSGPPGEKELLRDWGAIVPPWPAYYAVMATASGLDHLRNMLTPPPIRMIEHSFAFTRTQVIHILTAFSIPDHLASGPLTAAEIATAAGVKSEDSLWRVLRLAVLQGFLVGATDRAGVTRFRNNRLSATLRSDHPNSVRDFVLFQGQEVMPAWGGLVSALRSGRVPWEEAHPDDPGDFWDYMKARPELEKLFSRSMTNADSLGLRSMVADYKWGNFDRFIDVGGAHGSVLAALLRAHPQASGVLFDLPQVTEQAQLAWKQKSPELLSRAEFVGGSFFDPDALPTAIGKGDVFVMRFILHDWSDSKAIKILQRVRDAIGASNATLALMEVTPQEGLQETFEGRLHADIQMMVVCDGRERTPREWDRLFAATGFKRSGLHPTRGIVAVVEAVPI